MTLLEYLQIVNEKLSPKQQYSDDFINQLGEQGQKMKLYIAIQWLYESRYYKLFKVVAPETPLYKILDKANKKIDNRYDVLNVFKSCIYHITDYNFKINDLIMTLNDWNYGDLAKVLQSKYQ